MAGLSPVLAVATAQASLAVWPWELLPTVIYYSALVEKSVDQSLQQSLRQWYCKVFGTIAGERPSILLIVWTIITAGDLKLFKVRVDAQM